MTNPLGDFDFVLQVSADSVNKLFNAMHVAGSFQHLFTCAYEDRFVTLVVPPPAITLDDQLYPDGQIRARAAGRVLYHSRPAADATDMGYTAVVDVGARVRLSLDPAGDPAPLADSALDIDWTETGAGDMTIFTGAGADAEAEIAETLADLITSDTVWRYPIPNLALGATAIGNASLRFVNQNSVSAVAVGLNAGAALKGSRTQLQSVFVASDWAVGISASFITGELIAALVRELGVLPPPHGNGRPTLSDAVVCIVQNPLGQDCLASARQRVFLDALDWTFNEGRLSFSGSFSQTTDSLFIPSISASFSFDGVPTVQANGNVTIAFTQPSVQLHEWYASAVDLLSGGALTRAISQVMSSSLASLVGQGGSALLDLGELGQFASLGSIVSLPLALTIQSAELHGYGLTVQGTFSTGVSPRSPQVTFDVAPGPSPDSLIFNAQASWSPGDLPASYQWEFGDGAFETSSGQSERFVTSHSYVPGTYRVCLTLTNAHGATVSSCRTLSPGILQVTRIEPAGTNPWLVCKTGGSQQLSFLVTSNGMPVAGATMRLSAPGWQVSATSGADGQLAFAAIAETLFTAAIPAGVKFVVGCLDVALSAPGYASVSQQLLLRDCETASAIEGSLAKVAQLANQLAHEVLDPLGPVAAQLAAVASVSNPISALALDTVLVSELARTSSQFLLEGGDLELARIFFGGDAETTPARLSERLQGNLSAAAKHLQTRAQALQRELVRERSHVHRPAPRPDAPPPRSPSAIVERGERVILHVR